MIGTVLRIGWLNLRRDRVAQAMTFVLPIAFFSIFAMVFGGSSERRTPRITVAVVDEDGSETSARLVEALRAEDGLRVRTGVTQDDGGSEVPYDREGAREAVRAGNVPVALVIPAGFGASSMWGGGETAAIQIFADPADPVAPQMMQGLLQRAAMSSLSDVVMGDGIDAFERLAGPLTEQQRSRVDGWLPTLREGRGNGNDTSPGLGGGLIATEVVDVLREGNRSKPLIAFYAAGIGMMFLLFTCSAAGGALLEEEESGTLERILCSRLGMSRLLLGKWIWVALLGFAQITVMFAWGAAAFGLDLLGHLPGFIIVTTFTTAAASGLGLVLAAACRSRAQLGGLSTIVILVMSAVGGSMFPRFLMPEAMQKAGLLTFNGWALDAYQKVFWREQSLLALWPQLLVLSGLTVAFLLITRLLARRWETD